MLRLSYHTQIFFIPKRSPKIQMRKLLVFDQHKPNNPYLKQAYLPNHQDQAFPSLDTTTMPHASGYQHSDILLSKKPWDQMSPCQIAQLKKARQEKNQYEGVFHAGTPSSSEPLSNVVPASQYKRATKRQRARLSDPLADMSQGGPNVTASRNDQRISTKKPTIKEMAIPHPKTANPAEITSSVGTCAPTSSGPVSSKGTLSKSEKSSAPLQGQAENSTQDMEGTGSQSSARQAPTSPTSLAAANDSSHDISHTTKTGELPEAAGMVSMLSQDTVSLYDDNEYLISYPTAIDVDLANFNFSVSSVTSEIADHPTLTKGTKRKADVEAADIDANQGETKKMRPNLDGQNCGRMPVRLLNTTTTSNVKKTYQSPYPPTYNRQFVPPIAALLAGGQNHFSGTQPSFGTFGPAPQTTKPAQSPTPAVNLEGVVSLGFLHVAQTVQHINQGNVTYNIGQMTNVQNQYSGQTPQPPNHQHQRNNFQQPMTPQVHNPSTSEKVGSDDTFKNFPDYAPYHSDLSSLLPNVGMIPNNTNLAFNDSPGSPNHFQGMDGHFSNRLQQVQSLQPTSSVNASNIPECGVDKAARSSTIQRHMAPV